MTSVWAGSGSSSPASSRRRRENRERFGMLSALTASTVFPTTSSSDTERGSASSSASLTSFADLERPNIRFQNVGGDAVSSRICWKVRVPDKSPAASDVASVTVSDGVSATASVVGVAVTVSDTVSATGSDVVSVTASDAVSVTVSDTVSATASVVGVSVTASVVASSAMNWSKKRSAASSVENVSDTYSGIASALEISGRRSVGSSTAICSVGSSTVNVSGNRSVNSSTAICSVGLSTVNVSGNRSVNSSAGRFAPSSAANRYDSRSTISDGSATSSGSGVTASPGSGMPSKSMSASLTGFIPSAACSSSLFARKSASIELSVNVSSSAGVAPTPGAERAFAFSAD